MNNLHTKKRSSYKKISILILFLIGIFIIFVSLGVFSRFNKIFSGVSRGAWTANVALNESISESFVSLTQSKNSLVATIVRLQDRVRELELAMTNYQTLVEENTTLKEKFGRTQGSEKILATILVKPAQTIYDTLIVDVGARDNILVGSRVFASDTVILGEVSEVRDRTSVVTLYSSGGYKNNVVITGNDVYTEAIGRGGGSYEMTFPREISFPIGTEIVIPGITPYVIGLVDEVISDPRDPLQKVLLRAPVNIQELKFVAIEK